MEIHLPNYQLPLTHSRGLCYNYKEFALVRGILLRVWIPKVRVLAWRVAGLWFCSVSHLYVTETEKHYSAGHISRNKCLSRIMVWQFPLLFSVVYFRSLFVVLKLYLFHGLEFLRHFGFLPYSCLLILLPHQSGVFFFLICVRLWSHCLIKAMKILTLGVIIFKTYPDYYFWRTTQLSTHVQWLLNSVYGPDWKDAWAFTESKPLLSSVQGHEVWHCCNKMAALCCLLSSIYGP